MKRNNTARDFKPDHAVELGRKTAIHEAGHAAAIHLGNKQKLLPPVFFRIVIDEAHDQPDENSFAKVEGGRLIHTLPSSIDDATRDFSAEQKLGYRKAFEADIVNFMVGPLAEANYIALRDNELFTPRLINLNALHYYGGSSDLEIAHSYLECVFNDKSQCAEKISELFLEAHHFIKNRSVWKAITGLADYIVKDSKTVIDYEEIADVLDTHFYTHKQASWF